MGSHACGLKRAERVEAAEAVKPVQLVVRPSQHRGEQGLAAALRRARLGDGIGVEAGQGDQAHRGVGTSFALKATHCMVDKRLARAVGRAPIDDEVL